ncbi:peptide-N(4)-(N-acetyl-beta-glucosaminyl)asparagine amidase isoform X1 [Ziziphus jujuba]|nr:peptide-N(4)-(N-acetyl-beta-glucosaminyl)asparagine amidase isoform X1 [Ziziphus jujuba]
MHPTSTLTTTLTMASKSLSRFLYTLTLFLYICLCKLFSCLFQVFKFQLFSLTSVPPDEQKIVGVNGDRIVSTDSDLVDISEKLRLVSIDEEDNKGSSSSSHDAELLKSDEELARLLQAEEEALLFQQYVAAEDKGQIEGRIRPYVDQVRLYEDPVRQEAARKTVPIEELEEKALVSLAKEGNFNPSKTEQDHAFLLQLLFWFKHSFRWVNSPPCDGCGRETINQGTGAPLPSELRFGGSRVEIYRCNFCSGVTRFPRYNDPLKLIETRRGRCGEWANCFTLYCRAFGYDSRLVLDFTDHVWTECFSQFLGRWIHLDPCEGVYDKPLLYEKGWNKKLNYVIAIAKDGVYDVTKRYTKKWHEVLSRRNIITESALSTVLNNITKDCRRGFTSHVLSILDDRDEKERQALEEDLHSTDDSSISLPGRQSGDKQWRKSRLEFGSDENCSLSCSSCPVRVCVDEHVTRINDAFLPILSRFVAENLPQSRAIQVLEILKGVILDLQNSSFRNRKASIDLYLNSSEPLLPQLVSSFDELLSSLSLSHKVGTDGRVDICLAGNPVKTSIGLPVALDALDDTIHNLKNCNNFSKDSLSLPLLKLNRIHSGLVLASGEEIPFGIATSAFDGIRATKWEEPNGARGCWIMYKVSDNQKHKLAAYELMSANDAPERDPMDWVLEGSNDGGSTWHLLDERISQMFGGRFQRRTFKVASIDLLSDFFRFRFLAVRDVNSTSRTQIGSIDFYSASS